MANIKGCDLSHHNGNVNFKTLYDEGIDFCILKLGGSDAGLYKDSKFDEYYKRAGVAGLKRGAYYYVGKNFYQNSSEVLQHILALLDGVKLEYPFYLDIESTQESMKTLVTAHAVSVLDTLEKHGYFVGVYASDISGFKEKLDLQSLTKYTLWVARYGKAPQYVKDYGIWQYTEKGNSAATKSNVDFDYAKYDFSKTIIGKHFNNY